MSKKEQEKDSHWFSHDSNAIDDPKMVALISVYDMAGYGRWWRLVEILRSESGYRYQISSKFSYPSLAIALKFGLNDVVKFISDCIHEFELLHTDGDYIWSESLLRRMEKWDTKKKVLSDRGKKGAEVTNARKSAQATKEVGTSDDLSQPGRRLSGDFSGREIVLLRNTDREKDDGKPSPEEVGTSDDLSPPPAPVKPLPPRPGEVAPYKSPEDNKRIALDDDSMNGFVETYVRAGISTEQLPAWMDAFNRQLTHDGDILKQQRDYRKHFAGWIKFQDYRTGKPEDVSPLKVVKKKSQTENNHTIKKNML